MVLTKMKETAEQYLGTEDASSTNSLDLLLGDAGEKAGLDNDRLLGEDTLAQNLVEAGSGTVDDGSLSCLSGVLGPCLLRHQRPQLVQVDAGLVQVGVVGVDVEVPHSNLSEVSGMVL